MNIARFDDINFETVKQEVSMSALDNMVLSAKESSYLDLENLGIDISMISICKKIRKLAKLDRIKLDLSEHRSGLNKHLFDYIEYCGMDTLQFIKQYLSNLQPYMIERRKEQEKVNSFICVIDNLYRVSIYIKIDSKQFEEIVISFHEDNKRGIAKTNSLIKQDSNHQVPVFADCVLSRNGDSYVVKLITQRGMKILPIEISAKKFKDVFIVSRKAIDQQYLSYCNDYIRDLYTSDLDLNFDNIEVFSMLQQLSFTSYGNDTFSSISLLIDSICVQKDVVSRVVADNALVTFCQSLKLTSEQREELSDLLYKKYKVISIKGIDLILCRVNENLTVNSID